MTTPGRQSGKGNNFITTRRATRRVLAAVADEMIGAIDVPAATLAAVTELTEADLDGLVDEAIVDAYDEDEQLAGFYSVLEENLTLPFVTTVLGVQVTVADINLTDCGITAVCVRGTHRQPIGICDLPLPAPPPPGSEWISAYGRWATRR